MICFQCTRTVGYRRRDFLCDECREAVEPYYAITDEELRAARVLYDRTPRRPGAVIFTGLVFLVLGVLCALYPGHSGP